MGLETALGGKDLSDQKVGWAFVALPHDQGSRPD